jgi:hypothetical protein
MSTRSARRIPPVMKTPRYVVVYGAERLLLWGLFPTRADAARKADYQCNGAPELRRELRIERIWISQRQA